MFIVLSALEVIGSCVAFAFADIPGRVGLVSSMFGAAELRDPQKFDGRVDGIRFRVQQLLGGYLWHSTNRELWKMFDRPQK